LATQLAPRIAVTDLVGGQFKFVVLDIRGPEEYEADENIYIQYIILILIMLGVRECSGQIR